VDEPVLDRLGTIGAPTLLVVGALDTPYVALARLMEHALGNARLCLVPDAGHAVHVEQPDAFVRMVATFLRDSRAR
jgi:pimeloyl-ACP methyl ester carboxylesterase